MKKDDIVWIKKRQKYIKFWGYYINNKMIKSRWLGVVYTESHDRLIKNHPTWLRQKECLIMKINLKSVIVMCGEDNYLWQVPIDCHFIND